MVACITYPKTPHRKHKNKPAENFNLLKTPQPKRLTNLLFLVASSLKKALSRPKTQP